ncbi:hypothetical protein F7725_004042 [Dissostichus mawsoni]|uniref:Endonuclease/exonuclease/phosphatase domain-containing protein n=1 Tax=Dissostichus mawsoni TaxID=36200 RepID=A0A7J5YBY4_DISMA|nr:hypothetical protein F7725_004042 [Dissostichus mawsoni]
MRRWGGGEVGRWGGSLLGLISEGVCLLISEGVCLVISEGVCLVISEGVCLVISEGVCLVISEGVCLLISEGVCLVISEGVCLVISEGVCLSSLRESAWSSLRESAWSSLREMRLLCALGLFLALLHVTSCLLIGAFNIQQFGDKKSQNKDVMEIIKEIVLRYDIILIQEVLDKDLKRFSSVRPHHETVSVTDSFQYDGLKPDVFERPPFVVQFSSTETAVEEFVLIPIHTQPDSAVQEIDDLVDVVDAAKQRWKNNKNIMVLGDFNADGTYVEDEDWKKIRLFTNKDFHWLIADGVDTTVAAKSSNTYDRIVVTTEMEKGVVAGRSGAEKVSNHFPVEVELSKKNKKRKLNPN